jgi:hypothetical protein
MQREARAVTQCELDDADDGGRARRRAWIRASYPGCIQSCFAKVGLDQTDEAKRRSVWRLRPEPGRSAARAGRGLASRLVRRGQHAR